MRLLNVTTNDSIQTILDAIPLNEQIELHLENGFYYQKLTLRHNFLKLIGSGQTVISFDDHALKFHDDGLLFNTFRTETVLVLGDHIVIENVTIENTSGTGSKIGQAVALATYGNFTKIIHSTLKSTQDTLFLGPLPKDLAKRYDHILSNAQCHEKPLTHFIKDSTLIGNVDFIFGSSDAFLVNCTIISNGDGYIAAPSTHQKSSFGLVFYQCKFISLGDYQIILARPWRSGGKATFIQSQMDIKIAKDRYNDWDKPEYTFYELPYVLSPFSKPLPEPIFVDILNKIQNLENL